MKNKDAFIVTTPWLDRHNDYIQVYFWIEKDKDLPLWYMTDDSYILDVAEQSGIKIPDEVLEKILHDCNVRRNGNKLFVEGALFFPLDRLVQAIRDIDGYCRKFLEEKL